MIEIEAGLETLFTGDATLNALIPGGVHRGPAPEQTTTRFLTFEWLEPVDRLTFSSGFLDAPLLVKIVEETRDQTTAASAAARAAQLLTGEIGSGLAASGWTVMGVTRLGPFSYPEFDKGRVFQHVGGRFRILAQKQ